LIGSNGDVWFSGGGTDCYGLGGLSGGETSGDLRVWADKTNPRSERKGEIKRTVGLV